MANNKRPNWELHFEERSRDFIPFPLNEMMKLKYRLYNDEPNVISLKKLFQN